MRLFWFIPTHGDGRFLGTSEGGREVDHAYLQQVAVAADRIGYHGALLPTGRSCEDAWVVASSLVAATRRLRFLVALRPGLVAPSLAARMAATFDRISGGRLLVNIVTGGDPVELAGDGVFLDHDARYEVTDEFLTIWRALLSESHPVDYRGRHLRVEGARTLFGAVQRPYPPLYFGGSSPAGVEIAARHVDHYLTWGEPPAAVAAKIATARAAAARHGRTLGFGIRLHVIVRETAEEAWAAADLLISRVTERTEAAAREALSRHDSHGQRRMLDLRASGSGRARADLEISPNLWAGVGLVRGGAGTALVGSADEVAARIREYHAAGVETFILSGYPHLEEAYRTAELLFPRLPLASDEDSSPAAVGSRVLGEIVANIRTAASATTVDRV